MTTTRAFALHMLDRADSLCATVWAGDKEQAQREIGRLTDCKRKHGAA